MRRQRLEIEVVRNGGEYITFIISKQTFRNERFGTMTLEAIGYPNIGYFHSKSTGIEIRSYGGPGFENGWAGDTTLYVLGSSPEHDATQVTVNTAQFERIKKAITEFNEYFTTAGCGGLCGAVLCKECLANVRNMITFTFDGSDIKEIAV